MGHRLEIQNLRVNVEDKEILKGVNLSIKSGEVHAIMGPNGTGKSTLAQAIMGHYKYQVTAGTVLLDEEDILDLEVDERSRKGLFLAMQYPTEVSGVTNSDFIRTALQARQEENKYVSLFKFIKEYDKAVSDLKMDKDLASRYLNEGFSGGEKKRNEILQLKILKPKFAILDEIDSGLDVDALRIVGENVNSMRNPEFGALIITHYERILDYLDVDYVHIMMNGQIVKSGGKELIQKVDAEGYDWIKQELNIEFEEEVKSLGDCAHKNRFA